MVEEFDEKRVAPCTSCSWQLLMDSFHLHEDLTVYGFILTDYYMLDTRLGVGSVIIILMRICCAQNICKVIIKLDHPHHKRPRLKYTSFLSCFTSHFSICANSVSLCLYYPTLHRHYAPVFIFNLFLVVLCLSCDTMTVTVVQQGH